MKECALESEPEEPDESNDLVNEVKKLSSRQNAERVMNEAFQACDDELTIAFFQNLFTDGLEDVVKKINEKIDDALRIELKKLREEKKNEQLSCVAS